MQVASLEQRMGWQRPWASLHGCVAWLCGNLQLVMAATWGHA